MSDTGRDHLFLLEPGFADPAYPGRRFYCWHCALLDGVLGSFPDLARRLDVTRLPWPRPRRALVALVGEAHQSLPLLVLAPDAPDILATGRHGSLRFVDDKDAILQALHRRHGFPEPHP
ncbi:DUF3088 domain-containing protein [Methylobacterium nonmethylotrophicum]|uniref:DUF3088 domain-containing protein n=1 Tax=Methylobacterium nonmethylotrophicum TaxID=1141884 RepID=A0A4Z0NY17_9HYPH|nr:DUF3088 domain-containing protein [Methylobacterium nonmethylotrophicum]TGE02555.1 DUF3088 domain-containing protein [Methylobacterium nonmethylotrophicum]